MPFVFSAPLTEKLSWTFPEFFGKYPLIREQRALPFISLNVLEFKVSAGLWSKLCPLAPQKWPLVHRAEGRSAAQSQEDWEWRTWAKCTKQMPTEGKKVLHQRMQPGKQRDPWKVWLHNVYSPLCLMSHGGCSLFFRWRSCRNQLPNMPHTSMPSNYSL